jgi:hypothetical protein
MSGIAWDNIRPTGAVRLSAGRTPYQQGWDEATARIVAWLRQQAENVHDDAPACHADRFVEGIEAGEHLTPTGDR